MYASSMLESIFFLLILSAWVLRGVRSGCRKGGRSVVGVFERHLIPRFLNFPHLCVIVHSCYSQSLIALLNWKRVGRLFKMWGIYFPPAMRIFLNKLTKNQLLSFDIGANSLVCRLAAFKKKIEEFRFQFIVTNLRPNKFTSLEPQNP